MKYVCHFVKRDILFKKERNEKVHHLSPCLSKWRGSLLVVSRLSTGPACADQMETKKLRKKERKKNLKPPSFLLKIIISIDRKTLNPPPCFEAADVCAMWDAENASVQSLFFFLLFKVLSLAQLSVCVLQLFSIHHWTHLEMENEPLFHRGAPYSSLCGSQLLGWPRVLH